jgi:hypothetical protein
MILRILPEAELEIDEAIACYDRQRDGLGEEYLAALRVGLDEVVAAPLGNPICATFGRKRSCRWKLLRRVPHAIVCEARETDVLLIAVAHTARKPRYWRDRLA